jgi:uncharacterized iron-regulated membrane protein
MRKKLFKWHGYAGLIACLPLFIISITGSILVFKYELDTLIRGEIVSVEGVTKRQSMDSLITKVNEKHIDHEIVGWVLFQDPERSDVVFLMPSEQSNWYHIYLNGYTGEFLSEPALATDYFTDWLVTLHAELLLDHTGLAIAAVYSLILIFLGVTGLILHRAFWKNLFKLRTKARRILYYSDLHKLVGAWGSPILLVLGFTGGYWNIAHLVHELDHVGEAPFVMTDRMYNRALSFDELMVDAQVRIPGFDATYIRFPNEPDDQIIIYGDVPDSALLASQYASSITYDQQTGGYQSKTDIRSVGILHVIVDSFRQLHFGTFGGLLSRIIWFVVGIIPAILTVTGLYMWFKRRKAKQAKKNKIAKRLQERKHAEQPNQESIDEHTEKPAIT